MVFHNVFVTRFVSHVSCLVSHGFMVSLFHHGESPWSWFHHPQGLDLRDYIHPDCQPANPETKYAGIPAMVMDFDGEIM